MKPGKRRRVEEEALGQISSDTKRKTSLFARSKEKNEGRASESESEAAEDGDGALGAEADDEAETRRGGVTLRDVPGVGSGRGAGASLKRGSEDGARRETSSGALQGDSEERESSEELDGERCRCLATVGVSGTDRAELPTTEVVITAEVEDKGAEDVGTAMLHCGCEANPPQGFEGTWGG